MPIPVDLEALCNEMPAFPVGSLAGRTWWMPKPGVSRGQLLLGGLATGVLRAVRILVLTDGRTFTTKVLGSRIWDGRDVLMAPSGWTATTLPGTAIPLPGGMIVLSARNISSAVSITVPVDDVPHECFVSSGANAFAQPVVVGGTLGPVQVLPNGVVGGPDYQWQNGTGTGLIPHPGVELWAGQAWPENAPKE